MEYEIGLMEYEIGLTKPGTLAQVVLWASLEIVSFIGQPRNEKIVVAL